MAELALGEGIFNQACFHSQQCVEKALKACLVLLSPDKAPPRTHSVSSLLAGIPDSLFGSARAALTETMDSYYLPARYPDALPGTLPERLPEKADAEEAIELARQVWEDARRLVRSARARSPGP